MQATELLQRGMTVCARVKFLYAGIVYMPGDLFEYERVNADWNRVRLLFDQRKLEVVPISSIVPKEKPKAKKEELLPTTVVPSEEDEVVPLEYEDDAEEDVETETEELPKQIQRKRSRRK